MMPQTAVKIGVGKVQKVGGALYILIPVLWRRDHNVREGDTLEIFSDGGPELIVKPAKDNDGGGK